MPVVIQFTGCGRIGSFLIHLIDLIYIVVSDYFDDIISGLL